jgi:hypothetical protein
MTKYATDMNGRPPCYNSFGMNVTPQLHGYFFSIHQSINVHDLHSLNTGHTFQDYFKPSTCFATPQSRYNRLLFFGSHSTTRLFHRLHTYLSRISITTKSSLNLSWFFYAPESSLKWVTTEFLNHRTQPSSTTPNVAL